MSYSEDNRADAVESSPGLPSAEGATERHADLLITGKPKSLLANAVWNMSWTVWAMAVALFMVRFLIRSIGESHYGLYALLFAITGVLSVLNLGLAEATLRYVAYYYARNDLIGINRVFSSTLAIYLVMGLLGWAAAFFGAPRITAILAIDAEDVPLVENVIRLTSFSFGLIFVSGVFQAIPQAVRRYDVVTQVRVGQSLCYLIGAVVVILSGGRLFGLVLWNVFVSLFTLVLSMIMAKRLIPALTLSPVPTRSGLKEVFGYGVFAFVNQILGIVWRHTARMLLGIMVSSSAVAYLAIPERLSFGAISLAGGVGHVLFPRFSAMSSRDEIRRLYVSSTWGLLCMTVVVFVPIAVLVPDFLRLWISPEFAQKSAWVGQLIAASCIVRGAFIPYEHLFRGIGKPQYVLRVVLGSSLTGLIANLILIPKYGLAGTGYAFCITPVCGLVAIFVTWRYVLEMKDFARLGRTVLLPMVLGFIGLICFSWMRSAVFGEIGWLWLFLLGGLFVVVMAGVLTLCEVLLGRDGNQVGLVMSYVARLRARKRGA